MNMNLSDDDTIDIIAIVVMSIVLFAFICAIHNTVSVERSFESKLIDIDNGDLIFEDGQIVRRPSTIEYLWIVGTTYNVTLNGNYAVIDQEIVK